MWTQQEAKSDRSLKAASVLRTVPPAFIFRGQQLGGGPGQSCHGHAGGKLKSEDQGHSWTANGTY